MKRILMIANDNERWGPARLPEPLSNAGVEVAVLCPIDNPLNQTSFAKRSYCLDKLKSWRRFGKRLAYVMSDFDPDLIIPCDELVVAMLHYILKRPRIAARYLNAGQMSTLSRSIGKREMLDAMILKHQTRILAESLGVRVPPSQLVDSPEQALAEAKRIGFPVFLKLSFSWAGLGAIRCNNSEELKDTFRTLRGKSSRIKSMIKALLARDWYPTESAIEVQGAVTGDSVMYNAAALDGKMLGGMFASRARRAGETAPSTAVVIGEHVECRWMAETMIKAMGASGFLAFDFMCCKITGEVFLLECNPRPNQIFHLGHRVGADLCQALSEGLKGSQKTTISPNREIVLPLFPQSWFFDEKAALDQVHNLDVPRNDPILLQFMLARGNDKGLSGSNLRKVLNLKEPVISIYTFG